MAVEQALTRHARGDLRGAEQGYRRALAADPRCHEALQGLGLVMHQNGRHDQAASLIQAALELCPERADYHYNLAEVLRNTGRPGDALHAYREAIRRDDTQSDYFYGLGNALSEQGATHEAVEAYQHALRLAPSDAEIHNDLGNALAEAGDTDGAAAHLEKAVSLSPGYAEAHHNLSLVLKDRGSTDQALAHAHRACEMDPARPALLLNLANLLGDSGDHAAAVSCYRQAARQSWRDPQMLASIAQALTRSGEARESADVYQRLIELEPGVADHRVGLCRCLVQVQRFDEAEAESRQALESDPDHAPALAALGMCLQTRGQFREANELLERALERQPTLTEAAYLLAANGGYEVPESELSRWRALLTEEPLSAHKQCHLHFAVAKVYERRGEHEAAFGHFEQANRIKSALYPFNARRHSDYVDRIAWLFTGEFFDQRRDFGSPDARPVFIVGMPRSGSTLVEQILSSHGDAVGIGEHPEMRDIMRELPSLLGSGETSLECCRAMSAGQSLDVVRRYQESLPDEAAHARRVTDKMLGNFLRLGLVALLFPRARIVHCVRDAVDTCVSCYTQDFARGLRFTTDPAAFASFYRDYRRLMAHWHRVLPVPIKEVRYESLVHDPEEVSRDLVDFCGLPWDEACLRPHLNQRDVATASVWQARQPVYADSVGRSRRYEAFLGTWVDTLRSLEADDY